MKITATKRDVQGTSASRRLRHAGRIPAIVYGGPAKPLNVDLDHNDLWHALKKEQTHASILDLDVDGTIEKVLVRSVQYHSWRPQVLHIDFQRVDVNKKIHMTVPLHFINQENSPAVKLGGALVSHVMTQLDVSCLPGQLPEFIEVDLKELKAGESIHISQLKLPAGVTPVYHGKDDPAVVSSKVPGGASEEVAAAPAAAAPAPAAPAAKK